MSLLFNKSRTVQQRTSVSQLRSVSCGRSSPADVGVVLVEVGVEPGVGLRPTGQAYWRPAFARGAPLGLPFLRALACGVGRAYHLCS